MHFRAGVDMSAPAPVPPDDLALWASLYEHARQLRGDELRVLVTQAERLAMGRKQYGALDIDKDSRDWIEQAVEEGLDHISYLTIELVKLRRAREKP